MFPVAPAEGRLPWAALKRIFTVGWKGPEPVRLRAWSPGLPLGPSPSPRLLASGLLPGSSWAALWVAGCLAAPLAPPSSNPGVVATKTSPHIAKRPGQNHTPSHQVRTTPAEAPANWAERHASCFPHAAPFPRFRPSPLGLSCVNIPMLFLLRLECFSSPLPGAYCTRSRDLRASPTPWDALFCDAPQGFPMAFLASCLKMVVNPRPPKQPSKRVLKAAAGGSPALTLQCQHLLYCRLIPPLRPPLLPFLLWAIRLGVTV